MEYFFEIEFPDGTTREVDAGLVSYSTPCGNYVFTQDKGQYIITEVARMVSYGIQDLPKMRVRASINNAVVVVDATTSSSSYGTSSSSYGTSSSSYGTSSSNALDAITISSFGEETRVVARAMSVRPTATETKKQAIPTPRQIKEKLDQYVIGQEVAKRIIAVGAYNHYNRNQWNKKASNGMRLKKSNIMLVGPTGCGKTLIVSTLAKIFNVPWATVDCTELTPEGYVGKDPGAFVTDLTRSVPNRENMSHDSVAKAAEAGIVFLDEIDKLASPSLDYSLKHVSAVHSGVKGSGVQQSLLKILEGKKTNDGDPRQGGQGIQLDTTNMLFVAGGAFSSITTDSELPAQITSQQLIEFGLMPEFLGRFAVIATMGALSEDALCRVLTEPCDALTREYKELMKIEGVELFFERAALIEIARIARKRALGARALRGIMEDCMLDLMFDVPGNDDIKSVLFTTETLKTRTFEMNPTTRQENWL